ncbi:MAG: hypothetical protein Roseis2KO_03430 [Roseivirga sp.]
MLTYFLQILMKRHSKFSFLILLALIPQLLLAQADSGETLTTLSSRPLEFGQRITFRSEILDQTRIMNIHIPESFYEDSDDHVYPVLFIDGPHGDQFFSTVSGIVRHLSSVTRMPETIVISFHDDLIYAPYVYSNGMWNSREQLDFGDDPERFERHLREELFPYLKEQFRAADYRMIMGVSGSSLFTLHSFAKMPDLFDAHMLFAAADMVGMGYEKGKTFTDAFVSRMERDSQSKGQLYLSVAGDDVLRESNVESYKKNLEALETGLQPYSSENFKFKIEVVPDEGHYDYILKGLLSALEMIFPKKNWSPKFRDLIKEPGDALDNIDAFHDKLTAHYGFAVLPKADRWNSVNSLRFIGSKLLSDGRVKEAVRVFERRVAYQPRSVAAWNSLAEALKADGQTARAEEALKKAKLLDNTGNEPADEKQESLSKTDLEVIFQQYIAAQQRVFRKGSTIADAKALFDFYTADFEYNHPRYGGIYSRELLYNNTVKYLSSGGYDNSPERMVLKTVFGLDAIVVEQQYEGDENTTMTLIKFRGDKIHYIEEYW